MGDPDREAEWFGKEAYGADRMGRDVRRPLVIRLVQIAEHVGFDFRSEVLRASAWAQGHAPKRRWDRFYLNWFKRATSDGRQGQAQFEEELKRFS